MKERKPYSWEVGERPDPKDFMFMNKNKETLLRLPGTVNGQQFVIENCVECDIFILDHTATVTIDDCVDCRIFLGPVESSVFIRDSKNCKCAFICRQFRTRTVANSDFALLCATRPVIEDSKALRFASFDMGYAALEGQLAAAVISPFTNFWGFIHDFTPADATAKPNHSIYPSAAAGTKEVLDLGGSKPLPPEVDALFKEAHKSVALNTQGERPLEEAASGAILIFPPSVESRAMEVVQGAIDSADCKLANSNRLAIDTQLASELIGALGTSVAGAKLTSKSFGGGKAVVVHFTGVNAFERLRPAAEAAGATISSNVAAFALIKHAGIMIKHLR